MIKTGGNLIVNNIKVGDIIYEIEYGAGIKSEVITLPEKDHKNCYVWKSKNLTTGKIIDYLVHPDYPHYAPKLYDHEFVKGIKFI